MKNTYHLVSGGRIAIVAPSRYTKGFRKRIEQGITFLKNQGYSVVRGKSCDAYYFGNAGTAQERANELNTFFADTSIDAIFCALGGDAAIQLLPHLDYDVIKKNPKIFMGSSDATTIMLPLYKKTGLKGFHGPNTKDLVRQTVRSKKFIFDLLALNTQSMHYPVSTKNVVRGGEAEGKLLGGNLFVINSLAATKLLPSFRNAILFFEDIDEDLAAFEYQINLLKLTGILDEISGLIIGDISGRNVHARDIKEIILELTKNSTYPILKVDFFGHGIQNFLPMQLGRKAKLEARTGRVSFTVN